DGLVTIISGLYGILLVVVSSAVTIAEVFIRPARPMSFELLFIYLYLTSILFLVYVYIFLLHDNTLSTKRLRKAISRVSLRGFSRRDVNNSSTNDDTGSVFMSAETASMLKRQRSKKISFNDKHSSNKTGSFYLRLGALGFGIGSLVLDGLTLGEHFDERKASKIECRNTLFTIKDILKLVFTFTQLYFVFVNSKMKIMTNQVVSKMGLMHMTATNLSVWVRTIVLETLHTLDETDIHKHYEILHRILFVMWQNIGKRHPRPSLANLMASAEDGQDGSSKRTHRMSVDCSSSNRGLFMGLFLFVALIISLVCFYSMLHEVEYETEVILLSYATETIVYSIALVSTICAGLRMCSLKVNLKMKSDRLEETLIFISLSGLYLFGLISLIPGVFNTDKVDGIMSVVTGVLSVTQATLQTVFMLSAMRFSARNMHQVTKKPGREFVTFLLLTNFSMWMINTLETQKPEHNKMQLELYGPNAWSILVHVSVPLGIFYRFHSTVCLSHIWKNAWKMK
ncbi:hypothetical protein FSP39_024660, partial [Pinctada imbricata]